MAATSKRKNINRFHGQADEHGDSFQAESTSIAVSTEEEFLWRSWNMQKEIVRSSTISVAAWPMRYIWVVVSRASPPVRKKLEQRVKHRARKPEKSSECLARVDRNINVYQF